MVIPLAAGSAVDVAARVVMQKVSANIGQSIFIENLPGAFDLIGGEQVAKAAPDGYTIGGFNGSVLTMIPHIYLAVHCQCLVSSTSNSISRECPWLQCHP